MTSTTNPAAGLPRRLADRLCHGTPRKAMEPLRPVAPLARAIAWLLVGLGLTGLAVAAVVTAAGAFADGTTVSMAACWTIVAGLLLRGWAVVLRPAPISSRLGPLDGDS